MTTFILVLILLGLLGMSFLLWAWFLRVGLRWARVEGVTMLRVVLITGIGFVTNTVTQVFLMIAVSGNLTLSQLFCGEMSLLGLSVLIPCSLIIVIFKTTLLQAFKAWLPTLLTSVVMIGFVLFIVRPLLIEAFVIPTNSMAPTLLGNHRQGICQECGGPAFGSASERRPGDYVEPELMICQANFHITTPTDVEQHVFGGDRLLVAKYISPKRWDLVVFRFPGDPSIYYVKRLVGMPGEEITIQDGRVCANGKVLTPPDAIRGIKYFSKIEMPFLNGPYWGSPERPAKLGDDEYFMLGDFSPRAKDSRLWSQGAPGHPPYAVPESYIHGVVTHIYWPFHRWRTLR